MSSNRLEQRLDALVRQQDQAKQRLEELKPNEILDPEERKKLVARNAQLENELAGLLLKQSEIQSKTPKDTASERVSEGPRRPNPDLQEQLDQVLAQKEKLTEENEELRKRLEVPAVQQLEEGMKTIVQLESLIRES